MKSVRFAVAATLAMASSIALAQAYPGKPVYLVVGFPPGGGADNVARLLADRMSRELGQPVVMDYRPGAGTTIASTYVSRAAPDGYTIYMGSAGIYGADRVLYKNIKYEAKDFTPIARWTRSPMLLAVSSASGIKSTQDLIARAKSAPEKVSYASSGNGVAPHLAGRMFEIQSGATMMHVPFKGGAQAVQSVAAGDVDITFGTPPSILSLAPTGRITPIAVTTAQRSPLFPNLPTITEAGLKEYDYSFWFGLYGPAGLPKEIVSKLADVSVKILNDPEIKTRLAQTGNETFPSNSPAEFAEWALADGKRQKELMEKSGAKID
ncbi:tripartite tricarboxylate transporter substrate binding protein [Noviherbaspirillum cavernae]|uniref:Tripartite tricarboxylate transporter substrate binding protein n=1 Tax=Noviherbaspirillum cavernae TaxID=2320862 RepID=A0A418WVU7_9BURK|nr:tripartite tricarboxylate transporter substrate binding protein [Noviherbaspirillum cavernae]RJF96773.1 tripartite tricarboxylate transporter substrate binding protein [Noviherbaspirillum cavernae]